MIFNNIIDLKSALNISGLNNELKALYTYNIFCKEQKSIIFLTSSLYEANMYYQMISNYTTDVVFFPMDDFLTSEALAISPELKNSRLETMHQLIKNNKIVVTNLMGFLRYLPSKDIFKKSFINISIGKEYNFDLIIEKMINNGYVRDSLVTKSGEIAIRGFVIDIFPNDFINPIRIEFWGDTVESIKTFNVDSQLTISSIDEVIIPPNSEFLINNDINVNVFDMKQYQIVDYIGEYSIYDYTNNGILIINDYNSIINSYELLNNEMVDYRHSNEIADTTKFMMDFDLHKISKIIYLQNYDNIIDKNNYYNYKSRNIDNFIGTIDDIKRNLKLLINSSKTVIICLTSKYKIDKLINDLDDNSIIFTTEDNIYENKINIILKNITMGFSVDNYYVISEKELYNKKEQSFVYKTNFKMGTKIRDINKLEIGDYVVHNTHGIGIYCGIKTLNKNGLKKDYLQLEYRGKDKLYIPVEKLELISKYSAKDGVIPKINKLGGIEWQKIKNKVRNRIENIAGDLLKLYAQRESSKGFAFKKDDELQLNFEKEFIYNETKDQIRVSDEIKKDMESSHPMDRLLCGDVGYGKTEVAFRAVFKAILSGKQVAFLCPTTILSNQHYNNAIERFKSFNVEIGLLNRFVPPKDQKKVINDLKLGKIDLLIGTHRILSDDIIFKNLGLLIIDEEQRFGVKHKEKIKQLKSNIDVLTLSATPIPRTLQMSMAGVRSLSLIETPPVDRYPVQTYVLEENNLIIKDCIYKELARNGQAFILFNSIDNMDIKINELRNLVPEARFEYAHGKMKKEELENVMLRFQKKEFDVLLCTTIIETGIDIPTVNTLIIIDADHFGLSQLYQIRGRVGRSNKIAYCYLMYKKGRVLSEVAQKRLNVIKDFTELGSGFAIAMRDLSIRGAGDILGSEQAGFIDSVGVDLFLKMLKDEIDVLKGNSPTTNENDDSQPLVEVSTTIDDNYIKDEDLKIDIHKLINSIDSYETLNNVRFELEDRFGTLSEDIIIYMHEELFEKIAKSLNIVKVNQTKNFISIYLPKNIVSTIESDKLFVKVCSMTRNFRFSMKNNELIITLDIVNLDKHYIYYLIDLLQVIKECKK